MSIYQRINEVRKAVAYVRKDAEVSGRYRAVTHDMVTAVVRKALVEQEIIIVPNLVHSRVEDSGATTSKGAKIIRYEAQYHINFIHDDSEMVCIIVEAHAMDEGDKAPGKALSYATKYAMLKLFSLETGEDDESRIPDVAPLTEADVDMWIEQIKIETDPESKKALYKQAIAACAKANDTAAAKAIREGVKA